MTLTWRRVLRAVILVSVLLGTAGAVAYLSRATILTWLGRQLVDVDAVGPADAIVVLAGGTPERELEAIDLFKAGLAPQVVLTRTAERPLWALLRAKGVHRETEMEFRRRLFHTLGVPSERLYVLDPIVISTRAEAAAVKDWLRERSMQSLIVVTSASHTRRAGLIFERALAGTGVEVRMRAAEAGTYQPESWWKTRDDLTDGLIEWQKTVLYRLRFY